MFVKVLGEDLWINVTRIFELRIESGEGDYDYRILATYEVPSTKSESPSSWRTECLFKSSLGQCQDYINSLFQKQIPPN